MISGNGNLKRALSATTRPSAPAQRVATFGEEVRTARGCCGKWFCGKKSHVFAKWIYLGDQEKVSFCGDHCFCWSSIRYSTIFAFPFLLRSIFIFGEGSLRQMQDDSGWKTLVFFEHLVSNLRTWIHLIQYKSEPLNENTVGYDSELFAFKIWCFMHGCMAIIFWAIPIYHILYTFGTEARIHDSGSMCFFPPALVIWKTMHLPESTWYLLSVLFKVFKDHRCDD